MNCPECGAVSMVVDSRRDSSGGVRRVRVCRECGHRWKTLELDAEAVKATREIVRIFQRAMPRGRGRPRNPTAPPTRRQPRSGYVVPPEMESDWLLLKRNGYRDREAAVALGLEHEANP